MSRIYIKKAGCIYKHIQDTNDWIKMTNIKESEDRKVTFIDNISQYRINTNKAREEVNNYWYNLISKWNFNGKKYTNTKPFADFKLAQGTEVHKVWFVLKEIPIHHFYTEWVDKNDVTHKHSYDWYIVWYQGNLYWMTSYHYLPQCQLFKFESIDKRPGDFVKWTHVKNLKGVWNVTDKCYV